MGKTWRRNSGDDYALDRIRRENEKRNKQKTKRSYDNIDREEQQPPQKKW